MRSVEGTHTPGTPPPAGPLPPRGAVVHRVPTPRNSDGVEIGISYDEVYSAYFEDGPPVVDRGTKPVMPKRAAF